MSSGLRVNNLGDGRNGEEGGLFSEFAYKPETNATTSTQAAAGAPVSGAATAMGDGEGTSSGSEDTAWFEKPTKSNGGGGSAAVGGGAAAAAATGKPKVLPAAALVKTGWMSKTDASKLTDAQRKKNRARVMSERKKASAKKGGARKKGGGGNVSSDEEYGNERLKRAARRANGGGGGAASGGKKAASRRRRPGSEEDEEESCDTGDDSEDESEDEFEDDGDSSEDEDDDIEELTYASSEGSGDDKDNDNDSGIGSPTLADNAKKILATAAAGNKLSERKKARARAERNAKASAVKAESDAAARGKGEKERMKTSSSEGKGQEGKRSIAGGKEKGAGGGGGSGGGTRTGRKTIIIEDDDDDDDDVDDAGGGGGNDGVEVVGVKPRVPPSNGAVGSNGGGGGGAGGGNTPQQAGKKRRRVNDSDEEDSSGGEGGDVAVVQRVVPPAGKKKKNKKKKRYDSEDDDMDDSDRGSDSDADDGAVARKVLSECSALSKKLAGVISSWAGGEEEGAAEGEKGTSAPKGALEIASLKGGGKAVTTNEEIEEACPGLKLNPYQLVGVNWMSLLRETGVNGVLADEMGLGKTVQTIAFFALLRHRRKKDRPLRPHLVVVPSSVLDNWASELEKFCPALDCVKYHGSQKDRLAMRNSLHPVASGSRREDMPDIILTTYVIWERESSQEDRAFLKRFRYDYMVLDEGHSIKNIKSSRFQRLRVVAAKHRLLLSGTPVQNNLGELLALLSFLMPDIFRSDVIETLLEFLGENADSSGSSSSSSFQVREVRGMLAPFVLRRLKSGVLKQLVAKTEALDKVPLSKVQQSLYDGVLENHVRQKRAAIERALANERALFGGAVTDLTSNITRSGGGGGASSGGKGGGDAVEIVGGSGGASAEAKNGEEKGSGGDVLEEAGISAKECKNIFTELRKAANHPLMLLNHFKGGGKLEKVVEVLHRTGYFGGQATKEMVAKEVSGYSDFDLHQVCSGYDSLKDLCLSEETLFTSAKMERLRTLLPELVAKGHRILLFSQWTRLLDLLEVLLGDSMGLTFCRLDGSTPVSERKALIDKFGSDKSIPVFLLSTRAGGLGINLTSADTVILHDVDFNPENDRQAEDRCHRIGQTKPVTVIKMVAAGTVDEDIYLTGERKKEVNESVLNDSGNKKEKDAASTISGILKRAIQVHMKTAA